MLAKTGIRCRFTGKDLTMPLNYTRFEDIQTSVRQQHVVADQERQIFVLSIEPQMERKAAAHLIARGIQKALVPEMLKRTTRGAQRIKVDIRRPIFPGYVFILFSFALDSSRRRHIETAPGVHKFLRLGDDYAILPIPVMARILDIEEELLKPKKVSGPSAIFSPGEQVRVAEGPFTGLNAEIEELDDDQRISILLPLLGRMSKIHIEAEHLEKL